MPARFSQSVLYGEQAAGYSDEPDDVDDDWDGGDEGLEEYDGSEPPASVAPVGVGVPVGAGGGEALPPAAAPPRGRGRMRPLLTPEEEEAKRIAQLAKKREQMREKRMAERIRLGLPVLPPLSSVAQKTVAAKTAPAAPSPAPAPAPPPAPTPTPAPAPAPPPVPPSAMPEPIAAAPPAPASALHALVAAASPEATPVALQQRAAARPRRPRAPEPEEAGEDDDEDYAGDEGRSTGIAPSAGADVFRVTPAMAAIGAVTVTLPNGLPPLHLPAALPSTLLMPSGGPPSRPSVEPGSQGETGSKRPRTKFQGTPTEKRERELMVKRERERQRRLRLKQERVGGGLGGGGGWSQQPLSDDGGAVSGGGGGGGSSGVRRSAPAKRRYADADDEDDPADMYVQPMYDEKRERELQIKRERERARRARIKEERMRAEGLLPPLEGEDPSGDGPTLDPAAAAAEAFTVAGLQLDSSMLMNLLAGVAASGGLPAEGELAAMIAAAATAPADGQGQAEAGAAPGEAPAEPGEGQQPAAGEAPSAGQEQAGGGGQVLNAWCVFAPLPPAADALPRLSGGAWGLGCAGGGLKARAAGKAQQPEPRQLCLGPARKRAARGLRCAFASLWAKEEGAEEQEEEGAASDSLSDVVEGAEAYQGLPGCGAQATQRPGRAAARVRAAAGRAAGPLRGEEEEGLFGVDSLVSRWVAARVLRSRGPAAAASGGRGGVCCAGGKPGAAGEDAGEGAGGVGGDAGGTGGAAEGTGGAAGGEGGAGEAGGSGAAGGGEAGGSGGEGAAGDGAGGTGGGGGGDGGTGGGSGGDGAGDGGGGDGGGGDEEGGGGRGRGRGRGRGGRGRGGRGRGRGRGRGAKACGSDDKVPGQEGDAEPGVAGGEAGAAPRPEQPSQPHAWQEAVGKRRAAVAQRAAEKERLAAAEVRGKRGEGRVPCGVTGLGSGGGGWRSTARSVWGGGAPRNGPGLWCALPTGAARRGGCGGKGEAAQGRAGGGSYGAARDAAAAAAGAQEAAARGGKGGAVLRPHRQPAAPAQSVHARSASACHEHIHLKLCCSLHACMTSCAPSRHLPSLPRPLRRAALPSPARRPTRARRGPSTRDPPAAATAPPSTAPSCAA
jgi:hypothetical protein